MCVIGTSSTSFGLKLPDPPMKRPSIGTSRFLAEQRFQMFQRVAKCCLCLSTAAFHIASTFLSLLQRRPAQQWRLPVAMCFFLQISFIKFGIHANFPPYFQPLFYNGISYLNKQLKYRFLTPSLPTMNYNPDIFRL